MLIETLPPSARLIADKGYGASHFFSLLAERGTETVIQSNVSRKAPITINCIANHERYLINLSAARDQPVTEPRR